jgi:hypothetical protein
VHCGSDYLVLSPIVKQDWGIFGMIQMIIVRVECANLREGAVIQNIVTFFADINDKRPLIFYTRVAVHEIGEVG